MHVSKACTELSTEIVLNAIFETPNNGEASFLDYPQCFAQVPMFQHLHIGSEFYTINKNSSLLTLATLLSSGLVTV